MRCFAPILLVLSFHAAAAAGGESGLKRDLERAARAESWNEASIAARKLAAENSKAAVDALVDSAVSFPFGSVYAVCLHGLAKVDSPEAVERLVDLLDSGKSTEQMVVCDAVAKRSDAKTADALSQALSSRKEEVQRAAAAAIKRRRPVSAVVPLIDALEGLEKRKQQDGLTYHLVHDALKEITGRDLPAALDWRTWWDSAKDGFKPPARRPSTGGGGKKSGKSRPRFFGTEIVSDRVVFVIDVSGSMLTTDPTFGRKRPTTGGKLRGPKPPGYDSRQRIKRAKAQLELVVRALPPNAKFQILAYSGQLYRSGNGFSVFPPKVKVPRRAPSPLPPKVGDLQWLYVWKRKGRLTRATEKNKEKAIEFIRALQARGSTFTLQALKYALDVRDADLIVLLSDGAPTEIAGLKSEKMLNPRQLKAEIMKINRFKRIRIDTFQVGGTGVMSFGAFADFLKNLAKMTGGKYTEVR